MLKEIVAILLIVAGSTPLNSQEGGSTRERIDAEIFTMVTLPVVFNTVALNLKTEDRINIYSGLTEKEKIDHTLSLLKEVLLTISVNGDLKRMVLLDGVYQMTEVERYLKYNQRVKEFYKLAGTRAFLDDLGQGMK